MPNLWRCGVAAIMLLAVLPVPVSTGASLRSVAHVPGLPRACLVLDGSRDDEGFNQLAYEGALVARTRYQVNFSYVQDGSQSTKGYTRDLERFARHHCALVIGVGFSMAQAMFRAARAFPHTHFALIDSAPVDAKGKTVNVKNVTNVLFREQESGYLVGYMAGLMEKQKIGRARNNTIGVMGGLSIPPVNRYIAGFIQGARAASPGIKVLLAYNGSFTAQDRAYRIGLHQIARGAGILFAVAGAAGLGYLKAAQHKNAYGIGVDADQSYLGSYMMTSAVKKVDQAIVLTIGKLVHGTLKGGNTLFDLKNNGTGYDTIGSMVPRDIIDQVKAREKLIATGKVVPTGVISLAPPKRPANSHTRLGLRRGAAA